MNKVSKLINELKGIDGGLKLVWKKNFSKLCKITFNARKKVLNDFKSRIFPIKNQNEISTPEPTSKPKSKPTKKQAKKHLPKFLDEIVNYERNINNKVFNDFFKYHNPSLLLKYFHNFNETEKEKMVQHVNNEFIDLRNVVIRRKNPKNENSDEVIDTAEEILNFNKQQKGKGLLSNSARAFKYFDRTSLKILTLKQMLQRLPIALAQVQAV